MRILLTGATGLIGAATLARLVADGHEVVAVVRSAGPAADRLPAARTIAVDIARTTDPARWRPHLAGIDALVNCAGVLQAGGSDSPAAVHAAGMPALFRACADAGVRRIVHLSAIGVDETASTGFARSKRDGDAVLMGLDVDWLILRPSLVLGRAAYGGSALLRALAALPVLAVPADAGRFQPLQLDQLAATIAAMLAPGAPARQVVDIVGPERLGVPSIVAAYRRWLGLPPARTVRVPRRLAVLAFRAGDLLGHLGWRPPVRSTTLAELARDRAGDPADWTRLAGLRPRPLAEALAAEPASVQERWFASLYLLKPLLFGVLSLYWIVTGIVALGPGRAAGAALLVEAGLGALAAPAAVAGAIADILVGCAIAVRRTAGPAIAAAIALSAIYLVAGSVLLPALWLDPLGPLAKIVPIMALLLVARAILPDR
ncbi:MAG: SDR family oxidoreductase [Alphaproteobacteria bacterium]